MLGEGRDKTSLVFLLHDEPGSLLKALELFSSRGINLSKIESQEIDLKREPFSVYEILSTTVDMLQERAREKGLRISVLIDADVPASLVGDFNRIRQILINLVNNAIKFTVEGFVDIHVSLDPDQGLTSPVRFTVTDSGLGVDPSVQSEIFDSFTQVDSSLSREHSGVGLGLSICSKLARAMGGSCGVESAPGEGSAFWFTVSLPAQEQTAEGENWRLAIPANCSPALIVENGDPFAADWIARVFDEYGMPYRTAASGEPARLELTAAVESGRGYDYLIVPLLESGPAAIRELAQLAHSVPHRGTRLIVLSCAKEPRILKMMSEGLVAGWHRDTVCQFHFMEAVLGIDNERPKLPPCEPAEPSMAPLSHRSGDRILIVEDSQANRLIASTIIKNAGFEVEEASSGTEALAKCEDTDFDVVLMDLQMSEMDGFEATRAIRSSGFRNSSTPIIAFSANVMEETRQECLSAGMNDFVSKPFVKETLLQCIVHWSTENARIKARAAGGTIKARASLPG